jgi:hypothetical protein
MTMLHAKEQARKNVSWRRMAVGLAHAESYPVKSVLKVTSIRSV